MVGPLPLTEGRFLELLTAWGAPYVYGAGQPADYMRGWPGGVHSGIFGAPMDEVGWDCSGFAQVALVAIGILPQTAPDRSAAALWSTGTAVEEEDARLGDLVFYGTDHPSHVMVWVAPGVVIGATGGDRTTFGENPRAYVRLERLRYRVDVLGIRRIEKTVGGERA